VVRDAGGGKVFVEVGFELVVALGLVFLAAFLLQPHPAAAPLREVNRSRPFAARRADPGEGVKHDSDQRDRAD
jgi:hypothetical protein